MVKSSLLGPILTVISIIVLLAGYDLMTSSLNTWSLLTYDGGKLAEGGRVDRVVVKGSHASPQGAWYDDSLAKGPSGIAFSTHATDSNAVNVPGGFYLLRASGTNCQIGSLQNEIITANDGANDVKATALYTQAGTEASSTRLASQTSSTAAPVLLAGCEWVKAAGVWSAGGFKQLIRLIFEGAGLGLPLGVLMAIAGFGAAFMQRIGGSPIMAVVIIIVAFVMVGTLVDILTPFLDNVLDSLSRDRFKMYEGGLGILAPVIGNFYGVVLAAGGLYIGWMAIGAFKGGGGGGLMSGGGGMGNRM